ncbi:MAG TPA: SDR family NAD(P)-dependent oxidoreductase [Anaerolineales bacterium]|nr:SDR family NAD(P)-dependent oxidoreductase [Anaerolineales bacterium]
MSTYIVTGSAGFIGARVSELLIEEGHRVIGIDNMNDAYDVRIKEFRLNPLLQLENFIFYKKDIANWDAVNAIAESNSPIDGIINLAARAGVRASTEVPFEMLSSNTTGTLAMLELCRHYSIPKFVQASTSSIYGENPPYPTPETANSDYPLQAYAASKKGAEALCHSYHHLFNVDVSVLRFFTVYGRAGRPDLAMFRFIQWITEGRTLHLNGDGEQSRGFTYLDDIARGVVLALKPLGYEIINLGGHEVITINDLISLTEELVGKKAVIETHPAHPADMRRNQADVSKARKMLGWKPLVGLREGMQYLVDWYNEEREWARDIETL